MSTKAAITAIALALLTAAGAEAQTKTWVGGAANPNQNNWGTAINWSPSGVPTASHDVVIPASLTHYPSLGTTSRVVRNLDIQGGSVTLNDKSLTVQGNFTNSSGNPDALIATTGKVIMFRPTSTGATISGSTSFEHLEVTGASGVSSPEVDLIQYSSTDQTYGIRQSLKIAKGELDVNGQTLILYSECIDPYSVQTAYIDGSGNGEVLGDVTVQQCILPNGFSGAGFKGLSCPIQGCNVSDLSDDISGSFNSGYQYPSGSPPDWIWYDEPMFDPIGDDFWHGWRGLASNAAIAEAQGILAQFNPGGSGTVIDWTGEVNNGTMTYVLSYTNNSEPANDGWNIVGNPYPSPISWQEWWDTDGSSTDITPIVAVWYAEGSYNNGYFLYYDADIYDGNFDGTLGIGQGFYVQALADNEPFTLENYHRLGSTGVSVLKRAGPEGGRIRLSLSGPGNPDDAWLMFREGYTEGFDRRADGAKRMNPGANSLYAYKGGVRAVTAKFPAAHEGRTVPMGLRLKEGGTYTLTATASDAGPGLTAVLADALEGTRTVLSEGSSYTFRAGAGDTEGRFEVVLRKEGGEQGLPEASPRLAAYFDGSGLGAIVSGLGGGRAAFTVSDIAGRELFRSIAEVDGSGLAATGFNAPSPGIYVLNARLGASALSCRAVCAH